MNTMKRLAIATTIAVLALTGCGSDASEPATADDTEAVAPEPTDDPPAEDPPPVADPQGQYSDSCDYLLGDHTENTKTGYRFVADANLDNTGNIGTINRVTATWFQAGGKKIVAKKTVKVPIGESKRVGFTRLVGSNEIDLIQALDVEEQCLVEVSIFDTFGEPE